MADKIAFAGMATLTSEKPTTQFRWLAPKKSAGGRPAKRLQQRFHVETFGGPDGGRHSFVWRDVPTVTEGGEG